jgi:hypothetical protein
MLRPTVSRPVCLGIKHPSGAYDQIFTCVTLTVLFLWVALSDEKSGLCFVCATGPCQRKLSRDQVRSDLRPYFTVSDLRLPFSSPPTTRRVTVEVFDPVSTRVLITDCLYNPLSKLFAYRTGITLSDSSSLCNDISVVGETYPLIRDGLPLVRRLPR